MLTTTQLILWGAIGGIIPDLLRLIRLKEDEKTQFSDLYKSPVFYLGLVAQIVIGALVVYVFKPDSIKEALLIGYAAPSIVTGAGAALSKKLTTSDTPTEPKDKGVAVQKPTATIQLLKLWRN